jgi:hypothetical protein
MHDIRYDPVHDEIVVSNPFAQAIDGSPRHRKE